VVIKTTHEVLSYNLQPFTLGQVINEQQIKLCILFVNNLCFMFALVSNCYMIIYNECKYIPLNL